MLPLVGFATLILLKRVAGLQPLGSTQVRSSQGTQPTKHLRETPETFQPRGRVEGIHCDPNADSLAAEVVPQVPGLSSWSQWYRAPRFLSNGHVHTIAASQLRATRACKYHRQLLATPDGGTVALDLLVGIERRQPDASSTPRNRLSFEDGCDSNTIFVDSPPPLDPQRPFLLLISGLGGGSQDTYVRSMAVASAERGWQVGVLNMRGCGGSPITSPRFFSAFRGSTDDVRLAVRHVRTTRLLLDGESEDKDYGGGGRCAGGGREEKLKNKRTPLAVLGWSNGGTIVNNLIAEQATTHSPSSSSSSSSSSVTALQLGTEPTTATAADAAAAAPSGSSNSDSSNTAGVAVNDDCDHVVDAGVCLASPLDMVASAANLQKPFHAAVYDRSIARSLAAKFASARHLFEESPPPAPLSSVGNANPEVPSNGAPPPPRAPLPVPVPRWEGLAKRGASGSSAGAAGTFTVDVEAAATAKTIRGIDAALTAPCFGFSTVDEYYASASSAQRLKLARVPLLVLSAHDDPIAVGDAIPFNAGKENPSHVVLAVTAKGGHLGWCDDNDPWGSPSWVETVSVQFLEAALKLGVTGKEASGLKEAPVFEEFALSSTGQLP